MLSMRVGADAIVPAIGSWSCVEESGRNTGHGAVGRQDVGSRGQKAKRTTADGGEGRTRKSLG